VATTAARSVREGRDLETRADEAYTLATIDANRALLAARDVYRRATALGAAQSACRARIAAGAARTLLGDLPTARADLEAALHAAHRLGDECGIGRSHLWLAMVGRRDADYESSADHGSEALTRLGACGDRAGESDALRMIGVVQMVVGDFVSALDRFAEAREIAVELDDGHRVALSDNDTGTALFEMGDPAGAAAVQEVALAHFRRTEAITAELPTLSNLGVIASVLGDHALGASRLEECVARGRAHGERLPEARARYNLGRVCRAVGDHQSAIRHFVDAETLSRSLGERRTEIGATIAIARTLVLLGRPGLAVEQLHEALAAATERGIQRIVGEAHEALAEACEAIGRHDAAVRHLRELQRIRDAGQRAGAHLRMKHQETVAQLRREREEAEMRVLKAQLQPHFLLNALNSLATLIERRPSDAVRMVTHLGDLLRLALSQSGEQCTTLGEEIAFVEAYLSMETVRHRDRFAFEIRVAPELEDARVPHLLLQPVVENSVRHGLALAESGSVVRITAKRIDDRGLLLVVEDDGVGFRHGADRTASGIGLRNTRRRLERLYGERQRFEIAPRAGGGTRVEIELPLEN
jgi:tetratricopeptide (TPR) repeat protein